MTVKWKATLPSEQPEEGKKHIVIATGRSRGDRLEFSGQLTHEQIAQILAIALPSLHIPKEPS